MTDPNKQMYDSIIHSKSKESGTDNISEKHQFPLTRYSNILGAPHLVNMDNVADAFPDEYLLLEVGEITISDAEFNACFGDLNTIL